MKDVESVMLGEPYGLAVQSKGKGPVGEVPADWEAPKPGGQSTTPPSRSCFKSRRSTVNSDGGSRDLLLHSALTPRFLVLPNNDWKRPETCSCRSHQSATVFKRLIAITNPKGAKRIASIKIAST